MLEPAWMGADDPAERDLHQGLIKLAAAHVHAVRGNPKGYAKNLRGARDRLARAIAPGREAGLDIEAIVAAIDRVLAAVQTSPGTPSLDDWAPIRMMRRD